MKHSGFFEAALKNDWKEGQERLVTLPEDSSESFEIFYHFLYTGRIYCMSDFDISSRSSGSLEGNKEWSRILNAWTLAQKLLAVPFADACTDAYIVKAQTAHSVSAYQVPYTYGASGCGMRRLCVDQVVWRWSMESFGSVPRDSSFGLFWLDVAMALSRTKHDGLKGAVPYHSGETCFYHDHGGSTPCYKTMFA